MIGGPARLALRARLLTLSVVTTGSITLEATATGYARSTGSFLVDGYKPGMEVTPAGFPQTAVGAVTAVSALTLTILNGRTVAAAAAGRSLPVGLPSTHWVNVGFNPTAGVPYAVEEFMLGPAVKVTSGAQAQLEYLPTLVVKIHVPTGGGAGAADAYADAVLRLFPPSLQMIPVVGSSMHVRVSPAPYPGQLLANMPNTPGFAVIPVTVPLELRTPNVI